MLNGSASKFLVALLGVVASSLASYYSTAPWEPVVVMVLTAAGVYLVPNGSRSKSVSKPQQPDTPPIGPSWADQHQGTAGVPPTASQATGTTGGIQ